MEQYINKLI